MAVKFLLTAGRGSTGILFFADVARRSIARQEWSRGQRGNKSDDRDANNAYVLHPSLDTACNPALTLFSQSIRPFDVSSRRCYGRRC